MKVWLLMHVCSIVKYAFQRKWLLFFPFPAMDENACFPTVSQVVCCQTFEFLLIWWRSDILVSFYLHFSYQQWGLELCTFSFVSDYVLLSCWILYSWIYQSFMASGYWFILIVSKSSPFQIYKGNKPLFYILIFDLLIIYLGVLLWGTDPVLAFQFFSEGRNI